MNPSAVFAQATQDVRDITSQLEETSGRVRSETLSFDEEGEMAFQAARDALNEYRNWLDGQARYLKTP